MLPRPAVPRHISISLSTAMETLPISTWVNPVAPHRSISRVCGRSSVLTVTVHSLLGIAAQRCRCHIIVNSQVNDGDHPPRENNPDDALPSLLTVFRLLLVAADHLRSARRSPGLGKDRIQSWSRENPHGVG